ncbi:MAG: hypothetical protein JNL19_07840 [Burkholderiales bacterium]|nr:hypothetical protein [Burkholderiales bacterium]
MSMILKLQAALATSFALVANATACSCASWSAPDLAANSPVLAEVLIEERHVARETKTRISANEAEYKAIPVSYRVTRAIRGKLAAKGDLLEIGFEFGCEPKLIPHQKYVLSLRNSVDRRVILCSIRQESDDFIQELLREVHENEKTP